MIRRERQALLISIEAIAAAPPKRLRALVAALIETAVDHQLARPALARALDFVEPSLQLDRETAALAERLSKTIARLLEPHRIQAPQLVAADLVALAKGMIDAAGLAGETDRFSLSARVFRAAIGYLRNP